MIIPDKDNAGVICDMVVAALKFAESPLVLDARDSGGMSREMFRKEFGTVKIHLARQMGHTTAAIRLLIAQDDALLFVSSGSLKTRVREDVKMHTRHFITQRDIMDRVILANDIRHNRSRVPVIDRSMVILDNASLFTTDDKHKIRSEFKNARLIVELQ